MSVYTPALCFRQVKVMTDQDLLAVACEQFLGKSVMEIKAVVLQTLEGHLRSILGSLTITVTSLKNNADGFDSMKLMFCCCSHDRHFDSGADLPGQR